MNNQQVSTGTRPSEAFPIEAIDYIEFWVGNALQAAHFYRSGFGFDIIAFAGPETGVRETSSYLLQQGEARLLVTAGLHPDHPVARHAAMHGDGVHDVALRVPSAAEAFRLATRSGAAPLMPPTSEEGKDGAIRRATIGAYGDTVHTFVERGDYRGTFLPGFMPIQKRVSGVGIVGVDHLVTNVELGQMDRWVEFYATTMGFTQLIHYDDQDISTEYSALMSKVMQDGSGQIKLPINEPAIGRKRSQIQEYLDAYQGPGIQHIALRTNNILETVSRLRQNGIDFLDVPAGYYEHLDQRVGSIEEPMASLADLGILVDSDDEGYLLQVFSRPVQDRPTVFFEIIQRRGSQGFGKGNFKALFEAIEREQARRGNL